MAVAGVDADGSKFNPAQATKEGIQEAVDITTVAMRGNYVGPLVAAITFVSFLSTYHFSRVSLTSHQIPLLISSSASPSILLISSVAALIPAPTRSLYASTKAASLVLYQALSIEHSSINFSLIMPNTVEGDFRKSAVDKGPIRERNPNQDGLKREDVARRCIKAVDAYEKTVFMQRYLRLGHLGYWLYPPFVEWGARKKYHFRA